MQTTYAPQSGSYPDTNAPDLGYHYPVTEDSAPASLARVGQGIEDEVKRRGKLQASALTPHPNPRS
jgi:hypothetical protein